VSANEPSRRLVIGVGNLLLGDEGLGVHVARHLASRPGVMARVDVIDAGTALFDVAGDIAAHDEIIIVDAIRAGGRPGTVYRVDDLDALLDDMPDELPVSLHDWGAIDMLRGLRLAGIALPRITLLGAEPARVGPGTELSPDLRAAAARIEALITEHASSGAFPR
jgi:hydrogenase maturation protease